jgi:HD-GYP domain-containing protein (c-di-GMP phosphodiesterase class II)
VTTRPTRSKTARLAELLAALSLGTDLGMGQPMEHVLRQCLIALRLAERIGLSESERGVVYYVSLVAWVGCHIDAYEQAKWFGDDLVLKHDFRRTDMSGTGAASMFMLKHLGHGRPLAERARLGVGFVNEGRKAADAILENHWLAADDLAEQLGLGPDVRLGIEQTFERWDGKGIPKGASGQEITPTARLVNLADVVEVYQRAGGVDAAVAVARDRSGTQFDPEMVEVFCTEAPMLFSDLDLTKSWDAVIAAEPSLEVELTEAEFGSALEAVADFTDLKSPYTLGHSRSVADLAEIGARSLGLPDGDAIVARRAGLVHDLGRLGVSNAVWDREGELSPAEMERVRLHPYLTERMLASSPSLAPLGAIAAQHHERMDGSGYPRGVSGRELSPAARVLGAADMYHARLEPRPHRTTRTPDEAASDLKAEVRAGRLDGDAVAAVLEAAGHRSKRRREGPAGLTAREIEVLRLVARGLSNKEIARQLVIAPATARNHIEHIYAKIGVANRAQASLFATRRGLMDDPVRSGSAV